MRGRRSQGKEEEEEMAPKMRKFFLSLLPPGLQFGFKLKRTSVEVGLQLFRSSGGDVSGSVTPYKSRPPSHSPPPHSSHETQQFIINIPVRLSDRMSKTRNGKEIQQQQQYHKIQSIRNRPEFNYS